MIKPPKSVENTELGGFVMSKYLFEFKLNGIRDSFGGQMVGYKTLDKNTVG